MMSNKKKTSKKSQKKLTKAKKSKSKRIMDMQSREMLQPGARGGVITGPSNFPGYRGQ